MGLKSKDGNVLELDSVYVAALSPTGQTHEQITPAAPRV